MNEFWSAKGEPEWRVLSKGRCFVYVLPCREQDLLKVGFSREPRIRLQTLHPRYFELFDLDRSLLLELEHVRDARSIETRLKNLLEDHAAQPPLTVRSAAGGRTEWFLGASQLARETVFTIQKEQGWILHSSLAAWLRAGWESDATLFDWSIAMLEAIEFATFNGGDAQRYEMALRNVLDSFEAVGLPLKGRVSAPVLEWHRSGFALRN